MTAELMDFKKALYNILTNYFTIGDSYTYELTRTKAAFEMGTMTLEDFEEWTDDNVIDLAKHIVGALKMKNLLSPIQIGTPVYFINVWGDGVEQGTVSMIQQKADKSWKFRISYKPGGSVFDRPANDIGKSVFLTYDEAVKHLANNDVK